MTTHFARRTLATRFSSLHINTFFGYAHPRHSPSALQSAVAARVKFPSMFVCRQISEERRSEAVERWSLPYGKSLRASEDYYHQIRDAPKLFRARNVLRDMKRKRIERKAVHFEAIIDWYRLAGFWKMALKTLRTMKKEGVRPSLFCYGTAIAACEKSQRWREALGVLRDMQMEGVAPDIRCLTMALRTCAKCRRWEHAIRLFEEDMPKMGLEPDIFTYNAVISAYSKTGRMEEALNLLRELPRLGIEPHIMVYETAIHACIKGGQSEEAEALRLEMHKRGIKEDVFTYNKQMGACVESGRWQECLDMFREMGERGIEPDDWTFNTVISVCGKGSQWKMAVELLQGMVDQGIEPTIVAYNAAIEACFDSKEYAQALKLARKGQMKRLYPLFGYVKKKWDLHGFSLAISCTLLADGLLSIVEKGLRADKCFGDIIVVTGRGHGSKKHGKGPVLKGGVRKFLRDTCGLNITSIKRNDGAFRITAESLETWSKSSSFALMSGRFTE